MQQVSDWLEKLGLGQYAERFAENDIDVSVLPHLTDQSLKELGVSLGHRLKMLAAIKEPSPPTPATPQPAAATEAKPQDVAERRQVTVMFSDLVGSTALSMRMDPEDLREIISGFQKCVAETVKRFDGFVAKYMGDGVLVYFGYPQAHEDDAERAVRAGLELIRGVSGLKSEAALQTRVGIATGLVVVGDLVGSGEAQERGIVGETPNLAARLQGFAEPNAVVIAESTRKLLGNLFDFQDLGGQDLKGIGVPVRAWAVLRPASIESRFEALHASGLTALVGREEERELLLRRWSKVKADEGQVVLLSGEAGIGKSRLTAALMERLEGEPHTRLRYFCSPQHTDSALYPIIGQMERAAGLAHGDTGQSKLDKLDALLAQTSTSAQDRSLFADMLSLPNDGQHSARGMTPEQRRQKTSEALGSQIEALSRSNPVLMIFEDAHWADPTSLEVVSRIVDRLRNLRVLLIVTFRPEFDPPWTGRPYVTALTLNRLAQREIEAVIDNVIGNNLIPADIRRDIVERTDGIPLFVEEMTKAVLEAGSQQTVASFPSPTLAVPTSLQASLMARLDRLGAAKELAQVGAAIGREFPHALLSAVVSKPEPALGSALERLIAAGLLFRQGVPPHSTYLFKHALVQDAAYGTLLREPRRALHARIAETLEVHFPEVAENQPELLARHCTEAGQVEKAAAFWGKAGQRSLERSALVEAEAQFARALDQIAKLPATPEMRREQINLQVALANAVMHVKGYAAPETKTATERARLLIEQAEALGEPPEDPLLLFSIPHGLYITNLWAFNGNALRSTAAQLLVLAQRQGTTAPLLIALRSVGLSLLLTGDFLNALEHQDRALSLYEPNSHRPLATRFGVAGSAVFSHRSSTLWCLGYPEAALRDSEQALKDAREIGHAPTLINALSFATFPNIECGNYATAASFLDELAALTDKTGALSWKTGEMAIKGRVLALTGKVSDAIQMIESSVAARQATGTTLFIPMYFAFLAKAYSEVGQLDNAWRRIGEALMRIEATGESWFEAEVHRIAGEIALKSPEPDAGKACEYFERAVAIARCQQAKSWELRAAMSMARLWRDQGKRDEARELLAPIYGWFTEGFDTRDLKEAKALLDELAA